MWGSRVIGDSERQPAGSKAFREGFPDGVISKLNVERWIGLAENPKEGMGEHGSLRDPWVSRFDWSLGCNRSRRSQSFSGGMLRRDKRRGDKKGKRKNFILDTLNLMCLQNVQEGVWGWSTRARLGNTDLKIPDPRWWTHEGPAELMQGMWVDWGENTPRVTRMNKTNYRKCQHIRGMQRNRDREEDWRATLEDHHKEVVLQKSSAASINWRGNAR